MGSSDHSSSLPRPPGFLQTGSGRLIVAIALVLIGYALHFALLLNRHTEQLTLLRREEVRRLAQVALTALQPLRDQHAAGEITLEAARAQAVDLIDHLASAEEDAGPHLFLADSAGDLLAGSFEGLAAGVGVAILGQEALVQERHSGTAAWVLSKPVSRSAFVLAKIAGNGLGILVTMILVQGVLCWALFRIISGISLPVGGFIAGLGLAYLNLMFYLLLAVMLGMLFNSRGPVIGITLLILFGFQIFVGLAPWLLDFMPWILAMSTGESSISYATLLALGQPLPSVLPIVATGLWCLLFTGVALWRFSREQF